MRASLTALLLAISIAPALDAQQWSVSAGSGPFVFGHFAERTVTIVTGGTPNTTRSRLSAATRAGATADIERNFGRWVSVRLQSSWTRAPVSIKSSSREGITIDAGEINVTTFALPVIVHINRRAAIRFHIKAGPAYALYNARSRTNTGSAAPLFEGTRGRWGLVAGLGAAWWLSNRTAVEWQVGDIVTESPLYVSDIASSPRGVRIMRPHNGHTTIGVRYRF